jgi:hypothetical protein
MIAECLGQNVDSRPNGVPRERLPWDEETAWQDSNSDRAANIDGVVRLVRGLPAVTAELTLWSSRRPQST